MDPMYFPIIVGIAAVVFLVIFFHYPQSRTEQHYPR